MIALVPAAPICAHSPWSRVPPAALAARGLVAGAERVRLDPEVRDEVARDLPRERRADLRCHPLRGQDRQLRQGLGRSGGPGHGRLGTRGNAGEHEHRGEQGRAGERGGTEPVAARAAANTGCRRGASTSTTGRAAQTIQSAPSSATFVQNSVTCGAISSTASRATDDGVD